MTKQSANHPCDSRDPVNEALNDTLLQRLAELNLRPETVVTLTAGQSVFTKTLKKRYSNATVTEIDYIPLQAQKAPLPFATHSVDLIFSPLLLHACVAPQVLLQEIHRVLKPKGVFLFSVFGPDTLKELGQVLLSLNDKPYLPDFVDMHHWGDWLQNLKFRDPVVDVDYFTLYYDRFDQFMQHVQTQSFIYGLQDMNKDAIIPQEQAYEVYRDEHGLRMTVEIIYGIAFGADIRPNLDIQETHIPIQKVRRRN